MNNYRTLEYLQAIGLYDADELQGLYAHKDYKKAKGLARIPNEYQLMLYHSKVLKMPVSTFDREQVRGLLYYGILEDLARWDRDRAEEYHRNRQRIREEIQAEHDRAKRFEGVLLACLVYFLVMCAVVVGVCLWAWLRWR